jgi:hypothetical protein
VFMLMLVVVLVAFVGLVFRLRRCFECLC